MVRFEKRMVASATCDEGFSLAVTLLDLRSDGQAKISYGRCM